MCRCLASPGTCLVRCGRTHEAWSKRHINYCHRLASTHWKEEMQKCKAYRRSHRGKAPLSPRLSNVNIRSCSCVCVVALTTPEFQQSLFCCGDRPLTITHRVGACKRSLLAHCQKSEVRISGEPLSCKDFNSSRLPFPLALQHSLSLRAPLATYCCTSALHCSTTSGVIASWQECPLTARKLNKRVNESSRPDSVFHCFPALSQRSLHLFLR